MRIYDKIVSAFGILRDIISRKAEKTDLAPEFSTSSTYGEGALVMKDGALYRCTSIHSGSWSSDDFERTTVDAVLARMSMAKSSSGAAEATDAAGQEAIDAEYAVLSVGAEETKDPYEDAVEMKPSNLSTAFLKGDVKLCGASVMDFTSLKDLSYLFAGTSASDVTLSDGFARNATKLVGMFHRCTSLISVTGVVNNTAADMSGMFYGCNNLSEVNRGVYETGALTSNKIEICYDSDISDMFNGCTSLQGIEIRVTGEGKHTSPVGELFGGCSGLMNIVLRNFGGADNVDGYKSMLSGVANLTYIELHDSFNSMYVFSESYVEGGTTHARGPFTGLEVETIAVFGSFNEITVQNDDYNVQESRFVKNDFGIPTEYFLAENSFASLIFDRDMFRKCKAITLRGSFSGSGGASHIGGNSLAYVNIECNFLKDGADAIFAKDYDNSFGGATDRSSLQYVRLAFPEDKQDGAESQDDEASIAAGFYMCKGMFTCDIESSKLGLKGDLAGYFGSRYSALGCFEGCEYLSKLKLPDGFGKGSVDSSSCFRGCSSLKTLDAKSVGSNVKAIDPSVKCRLYECFYGCTMLNSLTVCDEFGTAEGVNLEGCFALCGFESVSYKGGPYTDTASVVLPATFGSAAANVNRCFENCMNLTTLALPNGFGSRSANIGSCFGYNTKLATLALPNDFGSLASTAQDCFVKCFALANITGAIKSPVSFDMSDSECLTHDSLMNVINGLVTVETEQTLTLGETNKAKLTESEITVATAKGWTIA